MNTILVAACASLGLGLLLYLWTATRATSHHFHTTNLISWLLIALFPVLIIFSFFPESSISGEIKGVSMGGAIAAFIFIWTYGTRQALRANAIDKRNREIADLHAELERKAFQVEELSKHEEEKPSVYPLQQSEIYVYKLKESRNKYIGLITGDMRDVKCADVWVNSENTNMQMSRFYELSVSGLIRYCGAKKNQLGNVVDDVIYQELTAVLGSAFSVQPAMVLVTSAGELFHTNHVKKICHVASTQGEVGCGYRPINDIGRCVTNVLIKVSSPEYQDLNLRSVLFPLIGSGKAKGNLSDIARKLFQAAISYLQGNENSSLTYVFFLTWTNVEFEKCKLILEQCDQVEFDRNHKVQRSH